MRARLVLAKAHICVELREVSLKSKPEQMLIESPKGTVPVLKLACGQVLDESLDIAAWACDQINEPVWSSDSLSHSWIQELDESFKRSLDAYKYADIRIDGAEGSARQDCMAYLFKLDAHLQQASYLSGEDFGVLDAMVFPFVRQFAGVGLEWFECQPWSSLNDWFGKIKSGPLFTLIMKKYPVWQSLDDSVLIDWS